MLNMEKTNEKISMKDIKEFETNHNVKFPAQYLDFMLDTNGGYPKASTFKISEEMGETVVNKFYGIGNMKSNLEKVFDSLDGELPKGFIAIADDPGGNQICIGINQKYNGKIYFWAHDMESDGEMGNMFLLADSFKDFFSNLY